jgi:hypothetical protein
MNLDDELRQLFSDDRLNVPVRSDAEESIVAGVSRIRRRRAVAASTVAAVTAIALIAGGVALAGMGRPQSVPAGQDMPNVPHLVSTTSSSPMTSSASTLSSVTQTSSTPTQASSSSPHDSHGGGKTSNSTTPPRSAGAGPSTGYSSSFGRDGYRQLKLGMTEQQALDTGMLDESSRQEFGGCRSYIFNDGLTGSDSVTISSGMGVVSIDRVTSGTTPEGVGMGSTHAQLQAAYPELTQDLVTPVPGNPNATYRFSFGRSEGDMVTGVGLARNGAGCG